MSFASKLVELRTEHNISQEELAEMLNVSRQSVSKWERGKGYPEIEKIIHISERFSISLDELLKDKKDSSGNARRTINLTKDQDMNFSDSIRTAYPENSASEEIYPKAAVFQERGNNVCFNQEVVSERADLANYRNYTAEENQSVEYAQPVYTRKKMSAAKLILTAAAVMFLIYAFLTVLFVGGPLDPQRYQETYIEDTNEITDSEFSNFSFYLEDETGPIYAVDDSAEPNGYLTNSQNIEWGDRIKAKNIETGEEALLDRDYCYSGITVFRDKGGTYVIPEYVAETEIDQENRFDYELVQAYYPDSDKSVNVFIKKSFFAVHDEVFEFPYF